MDRCDGQMVCAYQRAVCVDTEGSQRVLTHSPTHALSVFVLALKWGTDEEPSKGKEPSKKLRFRNVCPGLRG